MDIVAYVLADCLGKDPVAMAALFGYIGRFVFESLMVEGLVAAFASALILRSDGLFEACKLCSGLMCFPISCWLLNMDVWQWNLYAVAIQAVYLAIFIWYLRRGRALEAECPAGQAGSGGGNLS